jgi:hypothetical protein
MKFCALMLDCAELGAQATRSPHERSAFRAESRGKVLQTLLGAVCGRTITEHLSLHEVLRAFKHGDMGVIVGSFELHGLLMFKLHQGYLLKIALLHSSGRAGSRGTGNNSVRCIKLLAQLI